MEPLGCWKIFFLLILVFCPPCASDPTVPTRSRLVGTGSSYVKTMMSPSSPEVVCILNSRLVLGKSGTTTFLFFSSQTTLLFYVPPHRDPLMQELTYPSEFIVHDLDRVSTHPN
jgi:hypothetical protein